MAKVLRRDAGIERIWRGNGASYYKRRQDGRRQPMRLVKGDKLNQQWIRLSPALLDLCVGLGSANHSVQKKILGLDPKTGFRQFENEFITLGKFQKFIRAGFSKEEFQELEGIIKWWLKVCQGRVRDFNSKDYTDDMAVPKTFLDCMNTDSLSERFKGEFYRRLDT